MNPQDLTKLALEPEFTLEELGDRGKATRSVLTYAELRRATVKSNRRAMGYRTCQPNRSDR
jgi:hypothetical protein